MYNFYDERTDEYATFSTWQDFDLWMTGRSFEDIWVQDTCGIWWDYMGVILEIHMN